MNATLVIRDTNKFEDDIWQTDIDDFSAGDWKNAISNLADNAESIYNWIDTLDEYPPDFDPYILGDVINLLRSIDVKVGRR